MPRHKLEENSSHSAASERLLDMTDNYDLRQHVYEPTR